MSILQTVPDEHTLETMVARIVQVSDPEQIILFGSRARGDAGVEADVDLLVIESKPFTAARSRRAEMTRIWQALADLPVAKDILVYTREEVDRWRGNVNHIIARALSEGRVVYERR